MMSTTSFLIKFFKFLQISQHNMFEEWTNAEWTELALVVFSGVVTYTAILLYTRIAGLRSFSKMSSADFAMTVAVGSLFASTISTAKPTLIVGLVALATLFAGQWTLAFLRRKWATMSQLIDNQPLLLMAHGKLLDDNLRHANVTKSDIYGKLREANALNHDEVLAVVFETTGDISVLHSSDPDAKLERDFFEGVAGQELLFDR
jgi:uncharacterized membrane protein YcaP (DUF421 family)